LGGLGCLVGGRLGLLGLGLLLGLLGAGAGDAACTGGGGVGGRAALLGEAGAHPVQLLGRVAADDHGDVAGALADAGGATAGTGPPALEGRALVRVAGGDEQLVRRDVVVVRRVRDGRVEHLGDRPGGGPLRQLEQVARLAHGEAPDEVQHLPRLVGRHAGVAVLRAHARALVGLALVVGDGSHQRRPFADFSWPAWNLNVRVGANSPSLWPTIDSVTYTGTCLRPSCTAMVCPTMSGMIVDRRDQVLMTVFWPFSLRSSTFLRRWSSTNGPFLRLRGIVLPRSDHRREPRVRRLRTISFWAGLLVSRVRPSGLPHGDTGWRPPEVLPSPTPCGRTTGLIATPRAWGRMRFQRLRPALPTLSSSCSALPTEPTVARQSIGTRRISVEGRRSVAYSPSRATSCTLEPAERAILPPAPGLISTLCTTVPTGM